MIQVTVKESSNRISSFEMSGHADYAEHGQDLVCAGASAVSFGAVNAIMELTKIEPVIEQADSGFLKVAFPEGVDEKTDEQVQLLVRAMIVSLKTIEQDYGKYIKITFTA
ncbi:ribosomal-processing cysteine protease Prp [Planomicrobium sp. CPCC 101079]|uniref:ribosomal-processing cysteine protease Prp n=1 Tax=Planomicrobium sp. CPCC 101079 TaxID=2599618 RepID=UPI0011B448FB|nr:ribosomal-processing cysteine protease Prp [Planomicrobium sp. CPCC 101079]TWT09026.1 ribosomal-processing cysteine protease Prp [Planomicrobium sp. CPCC 101079]